LPIWIGLQPEGPSGGDYHGTGQHRRDTASPGSPCGERNTGCPDSLGCGRHVFEHVPAAGGLSQWLHIISEHERRGHGWRDQSDEQARNWFALPQQGTGSQLGGDIRGEFGGMDLV
jgi:hypothetical protein